MAFVEDNNKGLIRPLKREKYRPSKRMLSSIRRSQKYMKLCDGSKGFDLRGCEFMHKIGKNEFSELLNLYAKLGLHRYNLLQGKNLEFRSIKKYNQSTHSAACLYFITLEAMDPLTHSLLIFQTKVNETSYGKFILDCTIARPLGEETNRSSDFEISIRGNSEKNFLFMKHDMPEWPPENPFQNSKRCHVLNKSELQDNEWIRLYLKLAVAMTNRQRPRNYDVLSNLKILKVAIETTTTQDVHTHVAIVYIRYKDSCEDRVGKDVDRVAIIRRAYIEGTEYFRLVGQNLSSEIIPKKGKKQLLFSLRLKQLLLLTPRRLNGAGLSSKKPSARLSPSPWRPLRLKACKYNGVVGSSAKKRSARLSPNPKPSKKAYKYTET